jgi:hypothetical protein
MDQPWPSLTSITKQQSFAFINVVTIRLAAPADAPSVQPWSQKKLTPADMHVRRIELCEPHLNLVVERERARGLEIQNR